MERRHEDYSGVADEAETEDEEVKINCAGGVREYQESDCWDSDAENEEYSSREDER